MGCVRHMPSWIFSISAAVKRSWPDHRRVFHPLHLPFALVSESGKGACEKASRVALAVELEPVYVDVAVRRWQNFTGKQAVLDGDGRTFDEIAIVRASE